jgi:citrate synthase
MAKNDSLTITDNRTGKTYDVAIDSGAIRAMELRQIKVSAEDFGLLSYDPGLQNTASCKSTICFIDGDEGHPAVPRLSDRRARREEHVPRDRRI